MKIIPIPGGIMESKVLHPKEAQAFREFLKKNKLTVESFSRLSANFHYSTIAKWAGGFSFPSQQSLRDIQEVRPDCPFVRMIGSLPTK